MFEILQFLQQQKTIVRKPNFEIGFVANDGLSQGFKLGKTLRKVLKFDLETLHNHKQLF